MTHPENLILSHTDEILSVTEAAQRLGVSERTIYRMLKTGKLRCVERGRRGPRTRAVLGQTDESPVVQSVTNTSKVSNNATIERLEQETKALREDVKKKEEQIAKLIQSNLETQVSLNKIQEQMIEMARLILSKSDLSQIQTIVTNVPKSDERPVSPWARFFPSRRGGQRPKD